MGFYLQELPKALLPVANRPVLSYVLELLELSNLKDIIVVWFFFITRMCTLAFSFLEYRVFDFYVFCCV